MSEDGSVEAGRHTAQAFKALLSAALVVADAQRQRQVREMRRWESEARDRERVAERRSGVDTALERVGADTPLEKLGTAGLEDPVTLAQRWAAAHQPGADPAERVDLDKRVAAAGVDPQRVRDEHAGDRMNEAGRADAEAARRTGDTVRHEGVWQDGSLEVAKAGLSYTRPPGATITAGLTPQRRPKTPGKAAARTRDLDR